MKWSKLYSGALQVPTRIGSLSKSTNIHSRNVLSSHSVSPIFHTGRTFSTTTKLCTVELSRLAKGIPKRSDTLLMGCVCYDPSVGDIWSGIKTYLNSKGVPFDFVLFTNYEAQVSSLLDGTIDMAWNGPIAHVLTEEMVCALAPEKQVVSLGMRDCDRDFQTVIAVRKGSGVQNIGDLNGKVVLTGASDSPQAHVVPVHYLRQAGVQPGEVRNFDLDMGKHGDTALGEVKVLETLAADGAQDSQEVCTAAVLSKMMWDRAVQGQIVSVDGKKLLERYELLASADVPAFDHCQFDAILNKEGAAADEASQQLEKKLHQYVDALFAMDWDDKEHRRLMQLEGITKEWAKPRQEGYDIVRKAMGVGANHRPAVNLRQTHTRAYSSGRGTHGRVHTHPHTRSYASHSRPDRVAVIGAGVAGLQTVRALRDRGIEVTAYECANNIGGVWRENYANFGIQAPKQLYEFPDFPMASAEWGEFADGVKVQSYIEEYADRFNIRDSIVLNTRVTGVEQLSDDGKSGWIVRTSTSTDTSGTAQGGKGTQGERDAEFDYLVVATGLYSGLNQYMPRIGGTPKQGMSVLHSGDFRDNGMATGKDVVVVGSGKSAIDIAVNAAHANAKSVTMLQRNPHWPTPRKIAGLIPFQYVFLSRFGTTLVSAHRGTFPGGSGKAVNALRDSVIGRNLMKPIFGIVESLFAFQLALKKGETRPSTDVVSDFYGYANVLDNEYSDLRKSGKIQVRNGEIVEYSDNPEAPLHLKDGSSLDADVVVFGTGFGRDFSFFNNTAVQKDLDIQDDGLYLYRGLLPPKVPNLAFIGNTATASNIATYGLQAEWLARKMDGKLVQTDAKTGVDLNNPPVDVMVKGVDSHKAWAREWMPKTASRASLVLLHQIHYHDLLLKDMGLSTNLKSNVLAEYMMPYEPADYKSVISKGEEQVA
ncbi:hypothetical protein SARC_03890 [Sphaeroforma arctica JP610]|uniref:Flavin-containing monooxygenase n=1 Tax=Sphaeroforma arctica JP610 TaxID=667725 RepID=A0A0L0G485_9EUKA|nr:hypothetical protein SARC_03890 [Sphaeroforma arctica JP610]KNC83865.1 hypothetical protein SARC_03890 [Sphaeroforma arctica JP610]|eukprot:XP_014157767.1 hypothetical protein SARC_03890 [Sphaeroforma arctica JP610]